MAPTTQKTEELNAFTTIVQALEKLSNDQKARVFNSVAAFYGLDVEAGTGEGGEA